MGEMRMADVDDRFYVGRSRRQEKSISTALSLPNKALKLSICLFALFYTDVIS